MSLSFEPRTLFHKTPDQESFLVTRGSELVALVIRLSDVHGENEGRWFIDWACRDEVKSHKIFVDLEAVSDWIALRLAEISN